MDDYEDIMNDFGINRKSSSESAEKQPKEDAIPVNDDMKDENVNSSNVQLLKRRLSSQELLVNKLRQKTQSLTEKLKQSERHNRLLTDQLQELENISNVQQDDVLNENIQLKQQVNELNVKFEEEQKENEKLNADILKLQEENEYFKMKSLDHTKYKAWTPNDVYLYLMSIGDGLLKPYQNNIKTFLNDSQVKGADLQTFTMSDWNDCGIKVFQHRKTVVEVIKLLGSIDAIDAMDTGDKLEIHVVDEEEGTYVHQ